MAPKHLAQKKTSRVEGSLGFTPEDLHVESSPSKNSNSYVMGNITPRECPQSCSSIKNRMKLCSYELLRELDEV